MKRYNLILTFLILSSLARSFAVIYDLNVSEARCGEGDWLRAPHTYPDSLRKLYENAINECPNYDLIDEVDLWPWVEEYHPPKNWIYMLFKFEYPEGIPPGAVSFYNYSRWSATQEGYNTVYVYRYVCTTDGGYWVYVTESEGPWPPWPTVWSFNVPDSWYNDNGALWFMFEAEAFPEYPGLACDVFDIQYYYP